MAAKNLPNLKKFSNPESLVTYQKGFHDENALKSMYYSSFGNTGLDVSLFGFGGSALASVYGTPDERDGIDCVIEAVKMGINYIDTAPYYGDGKAEIVLGKALKQIPRNTYYLATKVGRYKSSFEHMFDFTAEQALKSVEESLNRLGVDYFDILQVHDVEFAINTDIVVNETLPVLQKLKESGKAKFIGITGYPISVLEEILKKLDGQSLKVDMVLSYCRCTLFDNTLKNYLPGFKARNLGVVNAAILGMGLLTNNGTPDWHPANSEIREVCAEAVEYCKKQNVNIAKLAAAHSFSQPGINIHLIGMQSKHLLQMNLISVTEDLTEHEKKVLQDIQTRFFKKLSETHWENKEVTAYWNFINNHKN